MEHAMGLLGELHKIKNISSLWDQGRANKTKSDNMPPPLREQEPPKCPNPQNWGESCTATVPHLAVVTTNSPLEPALARQQMAKMVAVLVTIPPPSCQP